MQDYLDAQKKWENSLKFTATVPVFPLSLGTGEPGP